MIYGKGKVWVRCPNCSSLRIVRYNHKISCKNCFFVFYDDLPLNLEEAKGVPSEEHVLEMLKIVTQEGMARKAI